MVDTRVLKAQVDLRRIVEQDLGPAPMRGGQALLWRCPFHHERQGYSLAVWADGFRCFGKCQVSGDALDWLQLYRHLSFQESLQALGEAPRAAPGLAANRPTPPAEPPPLEWQAAARQVVEGAEETLWSIRGEQALEYLTGRGLEGEAILKAHLGVVPGGYRRWRTIAGLNVPCGITIPWITGETLWAVKVRRAAGQPKYAQIAGGSSSGLYRGDTLPDTKAVLFCEGEFDALLAHQEASDLVAAVSLGSASSGLSDRWIIDLVTVPLILVAYDVDPAGLKGAARLQALSDRVHTIQVPKGKDITEFFKLSEEGAVFTWLARELRQARQRVMFTAAGQQEVT
ncbi:MAG: toprim domain-containing protein [Anaerolineae bacterium]|nr:toprim domain-containing protein [Anaerolineae bacterium]